MFLPIDSVLVGAESSVFTSRLSEIPDNEEDEEEAEAVFSSSWLPAKKSKYNFTCFQMPFLFSLLYAIIRCFNEFAEQLRKSLKPRRNASTNSMR